MFHSEEEIIFYLQNKLKETIKIHQENNSGMFISEDSLFQELNAETDSEKELIRMLASSAIDGFNFNSRTKILTDIDESEMERAAKYRQKHIEPLLPAVDPSYEPLFTPSSATVWFHNNIIQDTLYRDTNLPGRFGTALLIIFPIVIAFLQLGDKWYEIILRILAFLLALSTGGLLYSIVTDVVVSRKIFLKRLFHLLLFIIFPAFIYLCIKIFIL